MRISSFSTKARRRTVATVASLGVAGAIAVPGVAWAQNPIPGGSPVAVAAPAAQLTPASDVTAGDADGNNCSVSVKPISEEELQKLIDEGKAAGIEMSVATETTESVPADSVAPDADAVEIDSVEIVEAAVTVTAANC